MLTSMIIKTTENHSNNNAIGDTNEGSNGWRKLAKLGKRGERVKWGREERKVGEMK